MQANSTKITALRDSHQESNVFAIHVDITETYNSEAGQFAYLISKLRKRSLCEWSETRALYGIP